MNRGLSPYLRQHDPNAALSSTSPHPWSPPWPRMLQPQGQARLCASMWKTPIVQTFRKRDLLNIILGSVSAWEAEQRRWSGSCGLTQLCFSSQPQNPGEWRQSSVVVFYQRNSQLLIKAFNLQCSLLMKIFCTPSARKLIELRKSGKVGAVI